MSSEPVAANPIRELRKKLLTDAQAVSNAFNRWFRFASDLLQQADNSLAAQGTARLKLPKGFVDLTYLLGSVCDTGPFSIDPSPLTDFLRMCQHMEIDGLAETYNHSIEDFIKAADRVVPVANRLLWAMTAAQAGGGHPLLEPNIIWPAGSKRRQAAGPEAARPAEPAHPAADKDNTQGNGDEPADRNGAADSAIANTGERT
jgi:hypothetical protein